MYESGRRDLQFVQGIRLRFGAEVLEGAALLSGLNVGDQFMVCDLNEGDRFTVMRSAYRTIA